MALSRSTTLEIILRLKDEASKAVRGASQAISRNLDSIAAASKKLAVVSGAGFTAMAVGIKKLVSEGLEAEQISESFARMTKEVGYSSDQLVESLRKASAGTVDTTSLMLTSNRAMALGVGRNMEEVTTLMEIARVKGRALGLTTTQAFNDIVTGIGRGSPLILDNLGITIKQAAAQEQYAEALGKTAAELTDTEKKNALLNAVLTSGRAELEAIGEVQLTAAEQMQQLKAQFADIASTIGSAFVPVLQSVVTFLQPFLEKLAKWIEAHPRLAAGIIAGTAALLGILTVIGMIGALLPVIIGGFSMLTAGVGLLTAAVGVLSIGLLPLTIGIAAVIALIASAILVTRHLRENWETYYGVIKSHVLPHIEKLKKAMKTLGENITLVLGFIKKAFDVFFNSITLAFQGFIKAITDPVNWAIGKLREFLNLVAAVKDAVSSAAGAIGGGIRGGINAFVGSLPGLAEGGIVTKPTIAMVGEGGESEAIIPLSKLNGLGGGININIYGEVYTEEEQAEKMGNKIADVIKSNISIPL